MTRSSSPIYTNALRTVLSDAGFDDELAQLLTSLATTNLVAMRGQRTIIPTTEVQSALGLVVHTTHDHMRAALAVRAALARLREARWETTIGGARPGGPVLDLVSTTPDKRFVAFRVNDRFLAICATSACTAYPISARERAGSARCARGQLAEPDAC